MKSSIAIGSVFLAAAAFAQAPLGTVADVKGLVTVTDGTTGGTAAVGKTITSGMRFVTTSSGGVTLSLNNGCVLTLQPNQAVTVTERMTCQELMAAVQPVGRTVASASGSFGRGLLGVSAMPAAGFAIHKTLARNASLSTN